ncbi:hypothetical protein QFZ43_000370 [Streptomyces afghaniensis]|nr:hypothetical protein [Streptomyces afghaniensis]
MASGPRPGGTVGTGDVTLLTASKTPEQSHAAGYGQAVCFAAARPAARPEKRQPPRKVPSSAL